MTKPKKTARWRRALFLASSEELAAAGQQWRSDGTPVKRPKQVRLDRRAAWMRVKRIMEGGSGSLPVRLRETLERAEQKLLVFTGTHI